MSHPSTLSNERVSAAADRMLPPSKDEDLLYSELQFPCRALCLLIKSGLASEGGVIEDSLRNLRATQTIYVSLSRRGDERTMICIRRMRL